MDECGAVMEWQWQGKTEVLGAKTVTVTLYPPQMSYRLTWDWTRALGWEPDGRPPEPEQAPAFVSDRAFRDGVTHWMSVVWCMYVCVYIELPVLDTASKLHFVEFQLCWTTKWTKCLITCISYNCTMFRHISIIIRELFVCWSYTPVASNRLCL